MRYPLCGFAGVIVGLLPVADWRASAAESAPLSATIIPTVQYAHSDIYYRTPPGEGPHFTATRTFVADQRLDILVVANGATRDEAGKVNVVFDLRVQAPDGSTVEDRKDLRLAVDRSVPEVVTLFPTDIVSLVVKTGEPMGEYRLNVTLHDRVAGASASASQTVTVSADNTPLPWPENVDVNRWWSTYYLNPQPRLFPAALAQLSRLPAVRNRPPPGQGALLGFGDQVLKDNPWLVPHLKAYALKRDEGEQRILGLVIAYSMREEPESFNRQMRELLKTLPTESPEPLSGAQLDLMWGRFLGGGRFEPVVNLVRIIERYQTYRPAYDAYLGRPEPRGGLSLDERRGLLHATALWSLGSNARQHKRVAHYLTGLRAAPDTSESTKAIVEQVFAEPPPPRLGRSQP